MNIDQLYRLLDEGVGNESHLREYLFDVLKRQIAHPEESRDLAYNIAGLLSTKYAQGLQDDNIYMQIMLMAANLELPDRLHGGSTWEGLRTKINSLAET